MFATGAAMLGYDRAATLVKGLWTCKELSKTSPYLSDVRDYRHFSLMHIT